MSQDIKSIGDRCQSIILLEAFRILEERIASAEQIDRICVEGGLMREGPFQLRQRLGIDRITSDLTELFNHSFFDPRLQPSPLLENPDLDLIDSGLPAEAKLSQSPHEHNLEVIAVAGDNQTAQEIRTLADSTGYTVVLPSELDGHLPKLIIDCGADEDEAPLEGAPQLILLAQGSLSMLDPGGTMIGFNLLPLGNDSRLAELTVGPYSSEIIREIAMEFFLSLGKQSTWVDDTPGLVLGRIASQLICEATASFNLLGMPAEQFDQELLNLLPLTNGPLRICDLLGADYVTQVIMALANELRPDRYRVPTVLRKQIWKGDLGVQTGEGFLNYEDSW